MRQFPRGIRFQLSTLLLLSTLNGIAMAAGTILLFKSTLMGPSPEIQTFRASMNRISEVHNRILLVAAKGTSASSPPEDPGPVLEQVQTQLRGMEPASNTALSFLHAYRETASRWHSYVIMRLPTLQSSPSREEDKRAVGGAPTEPPSGERSADSSATPPPEPGKEPGWIPLQLDEEGNQLLERLNTTHRTLQAELALLSAEVRPEWVDKALQWAPWGLIYVILVALLTMGTAFRLRAILSQPLEMLRTAASRVAAGDLRQELPVDAAGFEIRELAQSLEAMRGRLVSSIQSLDARGNELQAILNSLSDGVLVLDSQGSVRECNPRAMEILSGRKEQTVRPARGLHLHQMLPELAEEVLEELEGSNLPLSFTLADGKTRYLNLWLESIRGGEREGDRVMVIRDTSHDEELEQMKRDFLSVVTHELKTPLTSIEGYTRLLMMGKGGPLTDKQRSFGQTIVDQTLALKEMIQNLLDITRLEGHNLPITPSVIDPGAELCAAAQNVRGTAQARNLTVEVLPDEAPEAKAFLDPFRLQQILGNLLSNAIKFTADGGRISLSKGLEAREVVLKVKDTGRGIPQEAIPRLFSKFYQVHRGDTRIAGGAGLGLYICHELCAAMGGSIAVSSTVGEGSCFVLRFPVAEGQDKAPEAQVSRAPSRP